MLFFLVDVVEIVALVMVITTLMGVIIVIIILLQGPPPFRQCPKEKVFFMGGLPLNIGFWHLSSWYLSASRWGTDQMEIRKYDLLAYLFTDGRTDWGAGDAYASKKLTDPLTHCSSFRRRYFKISFASKTKRT